MNQRAARDPEDIGRGAVAIETRDELARKWEQSAASGRPLRVKLGIDPTISDLHLGHAVPLRKLRQFQDHGHVAVLIIGDYTACVGDPSGRNKTRPQLTHEEVMEAASTYVEQASMILDREKTEVVYNGSWFSELSFLDVIQLASRTTVAQLLEREDFSTRYQAGHPISMHELLYPLMQAYDSIQVRADIEIGGSDQTFNLLLGRDLMRQEGMDPQVCFTFPLLVGTDGVQKMSKSYGNYIGINEAPEDMYGKTMSIPDAQMPSYFTLCTNLPQSRIEELLAGNPRDAKAALAHEIVRIYHGTEAARRGEEAFNRVFRDREDPREMEVVSLSATELTDGRLWIVELLVRAGLASTNNDARRKVEGGGVRIDGCRIEDGAAQVEVSDGAVLRVGKRHFRRISLT